MSLWVLLGSVVLSKKKPICNRNFKRFFKLSDRLVNLVYNKILSRGFHCEKAHLLWTLYYLRTINTNDDEIAATMSTSTKNMKIHVKNTLQILMKALPDVFLIIYFLSINFSYFLVQL